MLKSLLLCVVGLFLCSCAGGSRAGNLPGGIPEGVIMGAFQFALRDSTDVKCWSGTANYGGAGKNVLIISTDLKFKKLVSRPSLYSIDGKKRIIKADVLIKKSLDDRGLALDDLQSYSQKEDDAGREAMNIAPAFAMAAPFHFFEGNSAIARKIPLGASKASLPKGKWDDTSGYLVNYKLRAAVKIKNDQVYQVVAGDFFESQFGCISRGDSN